MKAYNQIYAFIFCLQCVRPMTGGGGGLISVRA